MRRQCAYSVYVTENILGRRRGVELDPLTGVPC